LFDAVQIDVGIKGVAPGYNTQQFLQQKVRQCKFWGGLALAGLAVSAHLFDQLCLNVVGTTLATTSLVIIVGAVLQTSRQVSERGAGGNLLGLICRSKILLLVLLGSSCMIHITWFEV
jgi:preprotein translocase subunit SecY